jgi:hypothetical protein
VTTDDLTPAQRDEVQLWMLRRFEQLRLPKGTRRQTDAARATRVPTAITRTKEKVMQTLTRPLARRLSCVLALAAIIVTCSGFSGCAPPPPNLTPAANQAFYKTRAEKALDVIRDTAQDGNATVPPIVSTATARKITTWHESALKIMHDAGAGWQAAVKTSLDELLKDVTPAEQQLLTPYVALAKTILQEVAP